MISINFLVVPILVNEANFELVGIRKTKQFVSFRFGDHQPLDLTVFLRVETTLECFLKAYTLLINRKEHISANPFQGTYKKNFPIIEDLLTPNNLLYDIDIGDGNVIGEIARPIVMKTRILGNYCNKVVEYVTRQAFARSVNLFFAPIVTLSSTELPIWSGF